MAGLSVRRSWTELRPRYGVYMRLLEGLPADGYGRAPIANMRTPTELAVHVSGTVVRDIVQGIARGEIRTGTPSEAETVSSLPSKDAVLAYCNECWEQADAAAAGIRSAELSAIVQSSWEMTLSGEEWMKVVLDEFIHHRGQLFAYSRALSVTPPSMWRFDQNDPAFRAHQDP